MKRPNINQLKEMKPIGSFLTPIEFAEIKVEKDGNTRRQILCACECGNTKILTVKLYLSGKTKRCSLNCPCQTKGRHGFSKGGKRKIYQTWLGMKGRCKSEKRYIKKGIKVCDEWVHNFREFYNWAMGNGWEEGLQLDRINNNGNYEPLNCRFTTPLINVSNRDCTIYIEYDNKRLTIREWAEITNIPFQSIYGRLKAGWEVKDILNPIKRQGTKLMHHKSAKQHIKTLYYKYLKNKTL